MSRTVLGVFKLPGIGEAFAFKEACDGAKVSFHCEWVETAEDAIAYLEGTGAYEDRNRHPIPALLILDWDLEDHGGWKVLRWIRAHPELRYLPVVVLAGSKKQVEMKRAYDRGASSYLLKPESFKGVVELIKMIDRYWLTLNQTPGP